MMSGNTCAVVVTFNRLVLLKECLSALNNQTTPLGKIVIVDNNSADGTSKYLDGLKEANIVVVHNKTNTGGAGGFSKGLEVAINMSNCERFWLLDDDTIVDRKANENFITHDKKLHGNYAFLISNVRWTDGTPSNIMTPSSNWPSKIDDGLVQVNYGTFVSFFVTRENVMKFGLPISEFFIWGDDAEYSLRLRHDEDAYFMSDVNAIHKSTVNVVAPGVIEDGVNRIDRYFYYYRNQMYIYRHYFKAEYFKVITLNYLKVIKVFIKAKNHKLARAKTVLKGLLASKSFEPRIRKIGREKD